MVHSKSFGPLLDDSDKDRLPDFLPLEPSIVTLIGEQLVLEFPAIAIPMLEHFSKTK